MAGVELRPIREADRDDLIRVLTDDRVKQTYMLPDFPAWEDAYKLFARLRDLSADSARFVRGVYLDDRLIGFLNDVQIADRSMELGWALHPEYHSRGYGTQAVKLAIRELFAEGFDCVTAGAFLENPASIRVMEKCGMEKITFTEEIEYRGKTHTCVYYRIEKA